MNFHNYNFLDIFLFLGVSSEFTNGKEETFDSLQVIIHNSQQITMKHTRRILKLIQHGRFSTRIQSNVYNTPKGFSA